MKKLLFIPVVILMAACSKKSDPAPTTGDFVITATSSAPMNIFIGGGSKTSMHTIYNNEATASPFTYTIKPAVGDFLEIDVKGSAAVNCTMKYKGVDVKPAVTGGGTEYFIDYTVPAN